MITRGNSHGTLKKKKSLCIIKKNLNSNIFLDSRTRIDFFDDIDLPLSATDEVTEEMYDAGCMLLTIICYCFLVTVVVVVVTMMVVVVLFVMVLGVEMMLLMLPSYEIN
jgi:hypothetical protein